MTDYNNSNDGIRLFAKGGITAAITINSGALIVTVSNLEKLVSTVGSEPISCALKMWAGGVVLATFGWLFATLAASAYANHKRGIEIFVGALGYFSVCLAIVLFGFAFWTIASGL